MVRDYPTTASAAHYTIADWRMLRHSGFYRTWPRHLHQFRSVDAVAG